MQTLGAAKELMQGHLLLSVIGLGGCAFRFEYVGGCVEINTR